MIISDANYLTHEVAEGSSIEEIFQGEHFQVPPHTVAARMDNELVSLSTKVQKDARLCPVTMATIEGRRIYQASISLVLLKAFYDLFPGKRIVIMHSISKGIYCNVHLKRPLEKKDVSAIKHRMQELVDADLDFEEEYMSRQDALAYFKSINLQDKIALLQHLPEEKIRMNTLHKVRNLWYYPLVPHTGMLRTFDLVFHAPGMILRFPRTRQPDKLPIFSKQMKLFNIFSEDAAWSKILEVTNVGELNSLIASRQISTIIKVAEGLHEKKIAQIADHITVHRDRIKFILIAGPSSSGKTTFSKRLAIQLRVNGIKTEQISTDNYFRPREETPRLPNGDYNFEDLEALDLALFNEHLSRILAGKQINIPKYSFVLGKPEATGTPTQIPRQIPVIIEGIHCLNEKLTRSIPRENKYLIYVSALTQLNIDDFNRIPTTDNRILRRLVRDAYFRGYNALDTLRRWPAVRAGEDKNIFPYQERADIMFNSALIYELAVLKNYALPLLQQIPRTVEEYSEAQRLIHFLRTFLSVQPAEIPPTSILREFIGNSSFRY